MLDQNQQPISPVEKTDGSKLLIHSIFPTIQGEGPYAGMPATFIRTAGCNLRCPLCDTEYTQGARSLSVGDIVDLVMLQDGHANLVVITGGEPLRQNITPLVQVLVDEGFLVQIETNGKLAAQDEALYGLATFVISPKTNTLNQKLWYMPAHYKYVISAFDVADDGLPIKALGHPIPRGGRIARPGPRMINCYVQPADHHEPEINKANIKAAVDSVMRFPGRRLCLQMHKYAGLD